MSARGMPPTAVAAATPSAVGAPVVPLTAEQATAVQAQLAQLEQQIRAHAQRIDGSLSIPYPREQARADYHALMQSIAQLEAATLPVASLAFDAEALSKNEAAQAAAASASASAAAAPTAAAPAASASATAAADASRFGADLVRMSGALKSECGVLHSYVSQVATHTRHTAAQWKAGREGLMQATQTHTQTHTQPQPHSPHNAQMHAPPMHGQTTPQQQQQQQQQQQMRVPMQF